MPGGADPQEGFHFSPRHKWRKAMVVSHMRPARKVVEKGCQALLDLLFPPTCASCEELTGDDGFPLCSSCYSKLEFIKEPYCMSCGRYFPAATTSHLCGECLRAPRAFDKARSLFHYEKSIKELLHNFKFSGDMSSLNTFYELSRQSSVLSDLSPAELILPVPLHINRLRERGFNQALLLAKALFPDKKQSIRYDILLRSSNSCPQTGLNGAKRRQNLRNAFTVSKAEDLRNSTVLLVDDVFTTGTTVQECAKTLKKAGCKRVEVLTLCRSDVSCR